jgi:hypothetical protein
LGIVGNYINSAASEMLDSLNNNTCISNTENNDIIQKIMSKEWDLSDNFAVSITNPFIITHFSQYKEDLVSAGEEAIISVNIPPMSAQEIDEVLGGLRKTSVRTYEQFRFSIRFRDYGGGTLRKLFNTIFIAQQYMYLDEIATEIKITQKGYEDSLVFKSSECLITAIQEQTLDHNTTEVSNFEVVFIAPTFTNNLIKDFGKDADYARSFDKYL